MTTAGIVFSNIHDRNVSQLTTYRTMASVPFGGRYRLIDFILSNMVNAGVTKVGIITKTNYQSLAKHVGTGKDWDLARKNGGVVILSPYGDKESGPLYSNRLEALQSSITYIDHCDEDYFIMADCDIVCNLPYDELVEAHRASGADITGVYKQVEAKRPIHRTSSIFKLNSEGRVTELSTHSVITGKQNFALNTWVINRDLLKGIIHESIIYGKKSLSRDVIAPRLNELVVMGYEFNGYLSCIDSLASYFDANMDLLDSGVRRQLFHSESYPIYTKVKDSAPTKYGSYAHVSNSIISDGCTIEGTVENSILFRGVRIAKNAVVSNSIIMQDSVLENNASTNYIITDKHVVIRGGRNLSGCDGHPFFIDKNALL